MGGSQASWLQASWQSSSELLAPAEGCSSRLVII